MNLKGDKKCIRVALTAYLVGIGVAASCGALGDLLVRIISAIT